MNALAILFLTLAANGEAPATVGPFTPTCKPPSVAVNGACTPVVQPKTCTFTVKVDAQNLRASVIVARSEGCDDALVEAALVVQLSKQFGVDK